jgi:hypothetical protein
MNRSGIREVAHVTVGKRTLAGEVRSGSTYMSQSDLRLQFGFAFASAAESLEVQWRGGAFERTGALPAGQTVTITEGRGVTRNTRYMK